MGFKINVKPIDEPTDGNDTMIVLVSDEAILGSTWHQKPTTKENVTRDINELLHELGIE